MDDTLVGKAVAALQAYQASCKEKGKKKLLDENSAVSLIIALKKIPPRTVRPHRIALVHTLYPVGETEMCLITKEDKSSVKACLEERNVAGVTKIIPVAKLKTNYKTYELKRRLSDSYDLFLTDKRLYHRLPHLLGKKFFEKKKYPLPLDLKRKDLAAEVCKARDATYLHMGLGTCCAIPIGRVDFPAESLAENVLMAMTGVLRHIPRGWKNIQSVHIKSVNSIALPIYNSLPLAPSKLAPDEGLRPAVVVQQPEELEEEEADMEVSQEPAVSDEDVPLEKKQSPESTPEAGATKRKSKTISKSASKARSASKYGKKKVRGSTVLNSKLQRSGRRRTMN